MAETIAEGAPSRPGLSVGRVRWGICALLFFATTINYVDRMVMGLLAAEILARTGRDPSQLFATLTAELGVPYYERIDVPATPKQKSALKALGPEQLDMRQLAG